MLWHMFERKQLILGGTPNNDAITKNVWYMCGVRIKISLILFRDSIQYHTVYDPTVMTSLYIDYCISTAAVWPHRIRYITHRLNSSVSQGVHSSKFIILAIQAWPFLQSLHLVIYSILWVRRDDIRNRTKNVFSRHRFLSLCTKVNSPPKKLLIQNII